MEKEDAPVFIGMLARLTEHYQTKPLSEGVTADWFRLLSPYELEDILHAYELIVSSREYPSRPMISHFIELLEDDPEDEASMQWQKVLEICRSGVDRVDTIGKEAVRLMGGMRMIGMNQESQIEFSEKRFTNHYIRLSKRRRKEMTIESSLAYNDRQERLRLASRNEGMITDNGGE
jgi:hypothetical protein